MRRDCHTWILLASALCWLGCGGGNGGEDDAGTDGGPPEVIEDLPIAEEITLPALDAAVDAVIDDRGIPHIYAATPEDAIRVQGYLMARDRMAQMEFLRRAIEGRLAEVAGNLDASMVASDRSSRLLGFHRQAAAAYEGLAPDDPSKMVLDAFSEGITAYIQRIRGGEASLPGNFLPTLLRAELLTDWTGPNTEALARYETYLLSFSGWADVDWSLALAGAAAAFPADSDDPRLAARAGAFADMWPLAPAEPAYTLEGFFDLGVRSARPLPPRAPAPAARWLPRVELLRRAQPMLQQMKKLRDRVFGGGSNSWIVSGAHTASGHPILANDPHLSLSSPPVWWLNHINTARAGGDWDVMGVSFAGTPGITLGFNRNVAWGATVNNYDVTDVYQEVITPGGGDAPDTVLFEQEQVPLETIEETIVVAGAPDVDLTIEVVPHHGPLIPDTRTEDGALALKWVGFTPSNELRTFIGFNLAETVGDVAAAMEHFKVGGQNIVAADTAGNILWTTRCEVPVRAAAALSWDPATMSGLHPGLVLPGTGDCEWIGWLDDAAIPHAENPEAGWLATANQDAVGTNRDGNPLNDEHFLTTNANLGHRQARLLALLEPLVAAGGITVEQMQQMQADHRSPLGAKLTGALVAALDRALEERASPGSHADLQALVAGADTAALDQLAAMRDRLDAWESFDTPAAVEGDPSAAAIADSVAATLFNATLPRLLHLAFDDEVERIGVRPSGSLVIRTLQFAILEPSRLASYDAELGDSVLWDDLNTEDVEESRDERMVRAALDALAWLEAEFATAAMEQWRWGALHTVRFEDMFGLAAFGQDIFSIPPPDDPDYPHGFPRHGDNHVVDASAYDNWSTTDFSYDHGPSQRLVVELDPDGPRAHTVIPGGNQHDPALPHHADEAELWRRNLAPRLAFTESEVVAAAESRLRFTP